MFSRGSYRCVRRGGGCGGRAQRIAGVGSGIGRSGRPGRWWSFRVLSKVAGDRRGIALGPLGGDVLSAPPRHCSAGRDGDHWTVASGASQTVRFRLAIADCDCRQHGAATTVGAGDDGRGGSKMTRGRILPTLREPERGVESGLRSAVHSGLRSVGQTLARTPSVGLPFTSLPSRDSRGSRRDQTPSSGRPAGDLRLGEEQVSRSPPVPLPFP